jgi:hypothetical protein
MRQSIKQKDLQKHLEDKVLLYFLSYGSKYSDNNDDMKDSATKCQFHQHFTCVFLYESFFSSYILALNELLYKKHVHKMLMKLTHVTLHPNNNPIHNQLLLKPNGVKSHSTYLT